MLRQNVYDGVESKPPRNRLSLPTEARIMTVSVYCKKIRRWKFKLFHFSADPFPCPLHHLSFLPILFLLLLPSLPWSGRSGGVNCKPWTNFRFLLCCMLINNSSSSAMWDLWVFWFYELDVHISERIARGTIGPTSTRFAIAVQLMLICNT